MLHFAAEHRDGAAIAVASNDQGFAPALARCSKLGAYTVAGAGPGRRLAAAHSTLRAGCWQPPALHAHSPKTLCRPLILPSLL